MDASTDPLGTLMAAAQEGDGAAYARLLSEVAPIIRRMVRRQWAGAVEAEDVVQDVLLSLHSVRHTYDPERPFLPWLATITRYRLADAQRRRMRRDSFETAVDVLPETFDHEQTKDPLETHEEASELKRAIAGLPAGQRQALELVKLRELSLNEASDLSGMSVAALKVAVHRGIKTLRSVLTR